MATLAQLNLLEDNYTRGVLKVREGDSWIEFQSMKDMRIAIKEMKAEISNDKPRGSRYVSTGNGY